MVAVLAIHIAVAALAGALGTRLGRRVFLLGALAPLATVVWVVAYGGDVLDGEVVTDSYRWVPGLGLELSFRVDALSLVMLGLVGGIGVLIFVYAYGYFHGDEPGLARFAALLVGFAGAMTGLVSADDLIAVFVFWELTSVTSYGLIGYDDRSAVARANAVQALIVTGAGGLAMLAGLLLIRITSGAGSFTELEGVELEGSLATAAALLVLAGAFTKSAQVPFHGWLPGAMAAPTPVSAYLHSATMVKAGVFIIARMTPAFHGVDIWPTLTITVGVATMLWGGYRALRQTDLKLLLAYGTVSQLGMLVATFGAGEDELYLAGVAMLIAHALFKAALFMTVGVIDHAAHTRQLGELSGVGRRLPVLTVAATIAAASMAGLFPFFGFVAKETILHGFLDDPRGSVIVATAGVVVGSGLTAAYTLRFLWGAFAAKPGVTTDIHRPTMLFVAPTVILALPTIVFGLYTKLADEIALPAAEELDEGAAEFHLHLWPGLGTAFWLSVTALAIGGVLFALRRPVERLQHRLARPYDAASLFQALLSNSLRGAARVTGVVQSGSLPLYLGVILLAALAIPLTSGLGVFDTPDDLVLADSWLQFVVAVGTMVASATIIISRRRFTAVLLLGANGFGVTALFVIQGAPDLALTQVLVEIVVVAAYVLVLRHLPDRFPPIHFTGVRLLRLATAGIVGVAVFVLILTSAAGRTEEPLDTSVAELAYPQGDGKNVVNVTLVDIRGFDTMGEIVVLVVAALGVAAVVRNGRQDTDPTPDRSPPNGPTPDPELEHA